MNNSDILKALFVTPFVIALGIAMMMLSYILVPLMVVGIVGLLVYSVIQASKEFDEED